MTARRLFNFLGCQENNLFVLNSSNPVWPFKEKFDYINQELWDIMIAHHGFGCGLKIGWRSKRKKVSGEKATRDEEFFDQEAKSRLINLDGLGFVYAPEGLSLKTNQTGFNLPLPPYFGDDPNFVLGNPIDLQKMKDNQRFSRQMEKFILTIGGSVSKVLDDWNPNKRALLQNLINHCL